MTTGPRRVVHLTGEPSTRAGSGPPHRTRHGEGHGLSCATISGVLNFEAMTRRGSEPGPATGQSHAHSQRRSSTDVPYTRRRFLAGTVGGAIALGAGAGVYEATRGASRPTAGHRSDRGTGSRKPGADQVSIVTRDGVALPVSAAIVEENRKPGNAWWVTTQQQPGNLEGYASQVSAVAGQAVTLHVNSASPQFIVEAYRMGYYGGVGARRVWRSDPVPGIRQPPPALVGPTNTIQCSWSPSLTFTVDKGWPPGTYLLKLVGSSGEQQFVPFCVRDDDSQAAFVVQQSVTTWQAYNRWGGFSLYYGNDGGRLSYTQASGGGTYDNRARAVSFDRPYCFDWASGASDFVGNELPVVFHAEKLGLDVTYWTDVDFHAEPDLLANHKALVSLGHDEYWSAEMRDAADAGVANGINFAFLGANACYRQIRLEPSPLGPNRIQVCYKSAEEDPMTGHDDTLVTVNWPDAPVSRPESELIGIAYQDVEADADMVVTAPSSWVVQGVDLPPGQRVAGVVRGEFDRYVPGSSVPTDLDVIAHSVVPNRGGNYSDVTWYTVPGGGGVFATGNASWVGMLTDSSMTIPGNVLPQTPPSATVPLQRMTENVYSVIGIGPAGLIRPSQGTWQQVYPPGSASVAAPDVTTSA